MGVGLLATRGETRTEDRSSGTASAGVAAGAGPSASAALASPSASAAASASTAASAGGATSAKASEVPTLDVRALPVVPGATGSAAARPAGSPEAEMALLRSAQDALGSAPADALARSEEHAKTYPGGALAEEREVLAVDALLRLGRRREAEARAARFRAAHPASAYLRRLETLLGTSD
jgi:hypothetical protein